MSEKGHQIKSSFKHGEMLFVVKLKGNLERFEPGTTFTSISALFYKTMWVDLPFDSCTVEINTQFTNNYYLHTFLKK